MEGSSAHWKLTHYSGVRPLIISDAIDKNPFHNNNKNNKRQSHSRGWVLEGFSQPDNRQPGKLTVNKLHKGERCTFSSGIKNRVRMCALCTVALDILARKIWLEPEIKYIQTGDKDSKTHMIYIQIDMN